LADQLAHSDHYEGESIMVEVQSGSAESTTPAEIRISRNPPADSAAPRWRIEVSYPHHQPGQVNSSWESER
jgi:hypothetical protein